MEFNKKTLNIGEVVFFDSFNVVSDGDLIVPDIKPDILKILQVNANTCISKKECADTCCTLYGYTDLSVLYLCEDESAPVQCIKTRLDFVHKIDNPNLSESCHIRISCDVSKVDFHIINSRKLHLKAINTIDCEAVLPNEVSFLTEIEESDYQFLKEETSVDTLISTGDFDFLIKESIEIPNGKSSVKEILSVDYKIFDKEIRPITEKIIVKANLGICVLYLDCEGCIEYTEAEIPFTEVFDLSDTTEDSVCDLNFRFCDSSFSLCEDSDGDMRIIDIELLVSAEIKTTKKECFDVIFDCFLPGNKTELSICDKEINEVICSTSSKNSLRENVAIDPSLPQISKVYNVITNAVLTSSHTENDRISVEGKIIAYILYLTDNPQNPLYSFKKEIPFSYFIDCSGAKEGMSAIIDVDAEHTSYRLNTVSEVEIRCILNISAKVFNPHKLSLIEDISLLEIPADSKKGIVVYFVQPGDTMWNIAKNYCVSVEDIINFNNLSDKNLSIGQRLIIPSCR